MAYVTRSDEPDGVAVVTLDRPPMNAMDLVLLEEIVEAVAGLAADPPAAVVVAGRPGVFSAGVDLRAAPGWGREEQQAAVRAINAMALGVYALACPVVAAVTGHAIAGGMVLAVGADVRVASAEGRYGLTEVKVGVPFPEAAVGVVAAELAPHAARRLVLRAGLTDAATCEALGVFDEVCAPDAVLPRALEVARELAALPADVYARTKHQLRGATIGRLRSQAAADPGLERWLSA